MIRPTWGLLSLTGPDDRPGGRGKTITFQRHGTIVSIGIIAANGSHEGSILLDQDEFDAQMYGNAREVGP